MTHSLTAIFHGSGLPLELRQLPVPALKPGEILVRNEYTTLCRSDLNTVSGKRTEPCPTILGHEVVGHIADFGPEAAVSDVMGRPLALGDRISWAIFASDPGSPMALRGIPQKGAGLFKYGHERLTEDSVLHGGLSQYLILRPHTPIAKLSGALLPGEAAIISCAVATAAGALRLAEGVRGKHVLISGAGMLGMIACAMSRSAGAASVTAMDPNRERLAMACEFGADEALPAGGDSGRRFDVLIELSGAAAAMEHTLRLLETGGTAVWAGATYPERAVQLPAEYLVRHLLTLKGLHNYNLDDFAAAVRFMEAHHRDFPFGSMIHDQFTLPEINEAFSYGFTANPFRVGVRIP